MGSSKGREAWRPAHAHLEHRPVFMGSDLPAEAAFAVVDMLGGTSVKVGAGEACTWYRVSGAANVTALLTTWAPTLTITVR